MGDDFDELFDDEPAEEPGDALAKMQSRALGNKVTHAQSLPPELATLTEARTAVMMGKLEHVRVGDEPQTGLRDWTKLVAMPADAELLTRRHLGLWKWQLHKGATVVLRPRAGTRRLVVGLVVQHHVQPGDLTDVPCSDLLLHWASGPDLMVQQACEVPNGLMLCYGDHTMLELARLQAPMEDRLWDYTREAPDRPFRVLPGWPRQVTDPNPVRAAGQQKWSF